MNVNISFWGHSIVQIPWDVEDYYVEHVKGGRDRKRRKFPNPFFGAFSEPLTVVDVKGRIVLWYLPGLLSSRQKVGFVFFQYVKFSHRIDYSPTLGRRLSVLRLC
jgi:hypothetical protein